MGVLDFVITLAVLDRLLHDCDTVVITSCRIKKPKEQI